MLGLFGLLLVAYAHVWGVLPAADDFGPPLYDILVGNRSLHELLTQTRQEQKIRPLQSLAYWLLAEFAGTGDDLSHPRLHATIHGANLALFFGYVALTLAIARRFLAWPACLVASLVVALHPVAVAGVAGVDAVGSLLSAVLVWGTIALVIGRPAHLARSLAIALGAFAAGFWLKEYVLALPALLPLAVSALPLDLGPKLRRRNALVLLIALSTATVVLLGLRFLFFPTSFGGLFASAPPLTPGRDGFVSIAGLMKNLGLLSAGLAFFGNTVALVTRSCPAWSIAELAWSGVILAGLGWGIWLAFTREPEAQRERVPLIGFAVVALPVSLGPELLVTRLSEGYMAMPLLPWGLLLGASYESIYRQLKPKLRPVLLTVLGFTCLLALSSIRAKVDLMLESGRRAMRHARLMIEEIPPEAHGIDVHVVFQEGEPRIRSYSVYQVSERGAATSPWALLALLPGRDLRLVTHEVRTPNEFAQLVSESPQGLWLAWRPDLERYVPVSQTPEGDALKAAPVGNILRELPAQQRAP